MRTAYIFAASANLRDHLYLHVQNVSESHVDLGRCLAVPVVLLDASLGTLTTVLEAIENVALISINLVGAAFSEKCALKDAYFHLKKLALIPVRLAIMPIRLIAQMRNTLTKPKIAMSMDGREIRMRTAKALEEQLRQELINTSF